jgi:hypothetical protein
VVQGWLVNAVLACVGAETGVIVDAATAAEAASLLAHAASGNVTVNLIFASCSGV